jgi:hypothetical protein
MAFGNVEVEQGDVLYLALEDPEKRLKARIRMLLGPDETVPDCFEVLPLGSKIPALGEGLEEYITAWLDAHPNARLVMIDTLARVRPKNAHRGQDWYLEDTNALSPLQGLANERGVMILCAGHLRKTASEDPLDLVSGSVGLTGVADTVAVLTRSRGKADAELFITGRDVEEKSYALSKHQFRWVLEGDAVEVNLGETNSKVFHAVRDCGGAIDAAGVGTITGLVGGTVRPALMRLVNKGLISPVGRGQYSALPRTAATSATLQQADDVTQQGNVAAVAGVASVANVADVAALHTEDDALPHWDEEDASPVGDALPADLDRWPAEPRYRVTELERKGIKRAPAMAKVRAELETKKGGNR